jgi:hypothetical protein
MGAVGAPSENRGKLSPDVPVAGGVGSGSLRTKLIAVGVLAVAGAGSVVALRPPRATSLASSAPSEAELGGSEGRRILNRVWLDRMPSSYREPYDFWVFSGSATALFIGGSMYRLEIERFEFERNRSHIELTSLQDGKTFPFTYEVKACSDKPPFDLCLHTSEPLRGKRVLYGFSDEDEAAHRLGAFASVVERARAATLVNVR